uniref:MYM-type domain-containing protein n=1 Tax=viral metagenome TaxID=1070528 RepID=A0A6C0J9N8_9ZZZZ
MVEQINSEIEKITIKKNKTKQAKAELVEAKQVKAKAELVEAKQAKAKQAKAKQAKAKQAKAKQVEELVEEKAKEELVEEQIIKEPKIPKKRGRKPKQINDEPKIPKKRGRKPKDVSLSKPSNNLNSESVKDTILHLKINSSSLDNNLLIDNMYDYNPDIKVPEPYDPSNNDLEIIEGYNPLEEPNEYLQKKNIIDEENENEEEVLDIDKYEKKITNLNTRYNESNSSCFMNNTFKKKNIAPIMMYYNEYNKRKEWPKVSNIKCFWCCHNFDNIPCALPYKFKEKVFYVFGNFCSPECSASYNFDSGADDKDTWERYSLLNHLYSIIYDTSELTIKLAPPKMSLKIFGGRLTIEEFRDCNNDYLKNYKIVLPPMVSIIPSLEEINKDSLKKKNTHYIPLDKDRISKVNNDLRLQRSKPISNRNTLENCMRLKYN